MTGRLRHSRRPSKRWLIAVATAAGVAIMYRFVLPRVVALYTHPERLRDRVGSQAR